MCWPWKERVFLEFSAAKGFAKSFQKQTHVSVRLCRLEKCYVSTGQIYLFLKVNRLCVTAQGLPWRHVLLLQKQLLQKSVWWFYLLAAFQAGDLLSEVNSELCLQYSQVLTKCQRQPIAATRMPLMFPGCLGDWQDMCFRAVPFTQGSVFLGQVTWPLWAYLLIWGILVILAFHCCEKQEIVRQIFVYSKYLVGIHLLCIHHVLSKAPELDFLAALYLLFLT